jgi:16S rRNA (uracil1498-N3)-methyltransferase
MNMILLQKDDFCDNDTVTLADHRFDHIKKVLKKQSGDLLKIGLLNSKMGTGEIKEIDDSSCTIQCSLNNDPPAPLPLTLILALPRPKMFRRTLFSIVSLGVKNIYIINTWKVDKSYWQSPYLEELSIKKTIYRALEQCCDTMEPSITLEKLFKPFAEDELPSIIKDSIALLAHPGEEKINSCKNKKLTLAIGPEGGFNDFEISLLKKTGFSAFSSGKRILRVEDAVPAIIGSLLI